MMYFYVSLTRYMQNYGTTKVELYVPKRAEGYGFQPDWVLMTVSERCTT